ncbi:hypothetical protein FKM82_026360 [Ascaphus truei]
MAAQKLLLHQALADLSLCLGRAPPPLTTAGCAELLRDVVMWAAPGVEPGSEHEVPGRAATAAEASLRLLEALRVASRDGAGTLMSMTSEEGRGSGEAGAGSVALRSVLRSASAPLLILCGAHSQNRPWTDSKSRALTRQLLRSLLDVSGCESVAELLRGPKNQEPEAGSFREVLGLLRPQLCKDTWELHPDTKLVFFWILCQVSRPWLSEYLDRVLPPSLLLSDDYRTENKVLGVGCLHHIIRNVPAAELRQYNRAQVIYHALHNHLYTPDADVIQVVLPCLLDLLPGLQSAPPAPADLRKRRATPTDQILQLVLTHMEMEHRIALRRVYARNLPALLDWLGVGVILHMKKLLCVIVGYLEVYDGPEEEARLCILETLQGTIKHAWPRIPCRLPLLLKTLLKFIYDISCDKSDTPEPVTDALLHSATDCLLLLDRCSKGQVKVSR